jgi:RNA polymerase sigma-70 factor
MVSHRFGSPGLGHITPTQAYRKAVHFDNSGESVGMTNKPWFGYKEYFLQAYQNAQSYHGKLDLEYEDYVSCLLPIITKYLGDQPQENLLIRFLSELHINDLYLTIACAQKKEAAWQQFDALYHDHIYEMARFECSNLDAALELSNNLLSDLYFSDRSNRPRIASYEGQSTLARWLRIVVAHRAINERARKGNHLESLDGLSDMADEKVHVLIESSIQANIYRPMILETFRGVSQRLSQREQYILLMRYEEEVQVKEIARVLGVHSSSITRQLQRIQEKMRLEVITILAESYHLSTQAIEECLRDMQENTEYSFFEYIRAG